MNVFSKQQLASELRKHFRWVWQGLGIALPRPVLRFDGPSDFPFDCLIEREGDVYQLQYGTAAPQHALRIDSYLYWLTLCPPDVASLLVDFSDGDKPSHADFAMSACHPDVTLLPDTYFFRWRGFRY